MYLTNYRAPLTDGGKNNSNFLRAEVCSMAKMRENGIKYFIQLSFMKMKVVPYYIFHFFVYLRFSIV